MSFPEKLKYLRESHNHTQQHLADLLGVQKSSISNYETGRSYPKRMVLLKLAQIYNVPPSSFLETEEPAKIASPNLFVDPIKKVFVYKSFSDCLLNTATSAEYCISIPTDLIGTGEYKAFVSPSGSIVIVDATSSPSPGDTVFARSESGEIIYGKYCKNASSVAIISKYIGEKEETAVFDIKKDILTILAIAVKIFGNMNA